ARRGEAHDPRPEKFPKCRAESAERADGAGLAGARTARDLGSVGLRAECGNDPAAGDDVLDGVAAKGHEVEARVGRYPGSRCDDLPVREESRAESRAERDAHGARMALRRARPPFAKHERERVVEEPNPLRRLESEIS